MIESRGIRTGAGLRAAWEDVREIIGGERFVALLLSGSAAAFVVKVAGAGLGFLAHLVLARALGVSSYGTFVYVYTWTRILAMVSRMGFQNSLVRFVPEYSVREEWALLKGACRRSFQLVALVSGLMGLGLLALVMLAPGAVGAGRAPVFAVAAVALPFLALLGVEKGLLRGWKHVALADLPELVIRPALLLFSVVVLYWFVGGDGISATGATALHSGGMVFAVVAGAVFLKKTTPSELERKTSPAYESRKWLSVSLPLLLVSGMYMLSRHVSLMTVAFLTGDRAAGLLGAGLRVSRIVVFGLSATNMIVAPLIAELYHKENRAELQRLLTVAAWGIFGITVLLSVGLVTVGPLILGAFGEGFRPAYLPLVIILIGQLVNSMSGAVGFIMLMTGHQNQAAVIVGTSVALNFVLCLILVPVFGVIGGAMAMCAGIAFWNIAMVVYVWRKLGLNPTVLPRRWMSRFYAGRSEP